MDSQGLGSLDKFQNDVLIMSTVLRFSIITLFNAKKFMNSEESSGLLVKNKFFFFTFFYLILYSCIISRVLYFL